MLKKIPGRKKPLLKNQLPGPTSNSCRNRLRKKDFFFFGISSLNVTSFKQTKKSVIFLSRKSLSIIYQLNKLMSALCSAQNSLFFYFPTLFKPFFSPFSMSDIDFTFLLRIVVCMVFSQINWKIFALFVKTSKTR